MNATNTRRSPRDRLTKASAPAGARAVIRRRSDGRNRLPSCRLLSSLPKGQPLVGVWSILSKPQMNADCEAATQTERGLPGRSNSRSLRRREFSQTSSSANVLRPARPRSAEFARLAKPESDLELPDCARNSMTGIRIGRRIQSPIYPCDLRLLPVQYFEKPSWGIHGEYRLDRRFGTITLSACPPACQIPSPADSKQSN